MPEMLTIKVTQVRETVVTANSLQDAITIASAEFNGAEVPKNADGKTPWGYVSKQVKQTSISADLT